MCFQVTSSSAWYYAGTQLHVAGYLHWLSLAACILQRQFMCAVKNIEFLKTGLHSNSSILCFCIFLVSVLVLHYNYYFSEVWTTLGSSTASPIVAVRFALCAVLPVYGLAAWSKDVHASAAEVIDKKHKERKSDWAYGGRLLNRKKKSAFSHLLPSAPNARSCRYHAT